jgi:hypothetical protein
MRVLCHSRVSSPSSLGGVKRKLGEFTECLRHGVEGSVVLFSSMFHEGVGRLFIWDMVYAVQWIGLILVC